MRRGRGAAVEVREREWLLEIGVPNCEEEEEERKLQANMA